MATEQVKTAENVATVSATDIPFDCPACGKSLVVDEAAEGLIVDCPQCRTSVIVPPKTSKHEKLEKDSPPRKHSGDSPSRRSEKDSRLSERRLATLSDLPELSGMASKHDAVGEIPEELAAPNALGESLQQRLSVLSGQLKEIQAQRTEVTGRIASRLNDVNRELILLARLEASQEQILSEWNRLVGRFSSTRAPAPDDLVQPAIIPM